MTCSPTATPTALEALLQGQDPGDEHRPLAMLADDLRVVTGGPPPTPSRPWPRCWPERTPDPAPHRPSPATARVGQWRRLAPAGRRRGRPP